VAQAAPVTSGRRLPRGPGDGARGRADGSFREARREITGG